MSAGNRKFRMNPPRDYQPQKVELGHYIAYVVISALAIALLVVMSI